MIAALLAYSIAAAIAIVELLTFAVGRIQVTQRLARIRTVLQAFHAAQDDDARQALLMRAGMATLSLSILLLVTLLVAGVVMGLPLLWIRPASFEMTLYMAALTLATLLWWRVRRSRT